MGAATGGGPGAGLAVADGVGVGVAVDGDGEGVGRAVGEEEAVGLATMVEPATTEAENATAGCTGSRVPAMTAAAARSSSLLNDEGL